MPEDIKRDFLNDIRRNNNSISFLVQSISRCQSDANSIVLKSRTENVKKILDECKNTEVLAEIELKQALSATTA